MKLYGLVGYPLSHSFSGKYFAEKFEREGIIDSAYNLYPLAHIGDLPRLINENPELAGLNVTIPYKEKVVPFLNSLDETIAPIGAVNTIKISRKGNDVHLRGFNTDVYGFDNSLRPFLRKDIKNALILGTGGASRAVSYVLQKKGIRITMVSRKPVKVNHISYDDLNAALIKDSKLIVNTSPAGMYPDTGSCPPIPYEYISGDHILYDLIYNPAVTLFMEKGKAGGATVTNGMEMLQLQAEKAWEIWNSDNL